LKKKYILVLLSLVMKIKVRNTMSEHQTVCLPWDCAEQGKRIRVAVIGDLILDEYLEGEVNRISPEAPVPIHLVKSTRLTAGGAANVARNVQLAGGEARLFGVLGDDPSAAALLKILTDDRIVTTDVLVDHKRPTIKKTRVTSNHNQLVRIDWEKVTPISEALQQELFKRLTATRVDAILLSDYGKGCLAKPFVKMVIDHARSQKIPVIIDPKGRDYTLYQGCFMITPNRKEACEALGLDPSDSWPKEELGRKLQEKYGLSHVLITLGPQGMYLSPDPASPHVEPVYLPAHTREVFDVSGAGDTVAAIMALSLGASSTEIRDAMVLANVGAGRVIEKWGTQPIYKHELLDAVKQYHIMLHEPKGSSLRKITDALSLKQILGDAATRARKVVFTNGCFDILHAGHVSYLEKAKEKGDLLVIGVNTDRSVRSIKGPTRPIVPDKHRMRLLAALECVDYVVPFDEDTPDALIRTLVPNVLIKGADYRPEAIVGADTVLAAGGSVDVIEFVEGLSTSNIIEKIVSTTT
jgi:D-beta-D-heptose 7-phosphate kinase/D-beta-D-heptose 1-phosphate adenosyltransferase